MDPNLTTCPECGGNGCECCLFTGEIEDDADYSHSTSLLEDYPDTPTPEEIIREIEV
jgi:hypothetical protein